ncbi:MAG: MarR family transcriptional regulator [Clostridia bacterium]|nr:MarR family transcriptional regulator [Clostridia bacterium]
MESVTREKLTRDFGNAFLSLQHTSTLCMQLLLSKYNLYPGQPQVLFALKELGAPTQNELAAYLGVGKASAGVSIRRLESGGFVKRTRDKKDTRCIRLSLTQKGEEFARWCNIDFDMFFTTMLEELSLDERASAYEFIQSMEKSLTGLKERLES